MMNAKKGNMEQLGNSVFASVAHITSAFSDMNNLWNSRKRELTDRKSEVLQTCTELEQIASQAKEKWDAEKIKLKADPSHPEAKRESRKSAIIELLQKRLSALKNELASAQAKNEALEKLVSTAQPANALNTAPTSTTSASTTMTTGTTIKATDETPTPSSTTEATAFSLSAAECIVHLQEITQNLVGSCSRNRASAQDSVTEVANQCQKMKAEMEEMNVKLVSSEKEGQRFSKRSAVLGLLKQRITELKAENAKLESELEAKRRELKSTVDTLATTEDERRALIDLKREITRLVVSPLGKQAGGSEVPSDLNENRLLISAFQKILSCSESLQSAATNAQQELENFKSQTESRMAVLLAQHQNMCQENQDLRRDASQKTRDLELARHELQLALDDLCTLRESNQHLSMEYVELKEVQQSKMKQLTEQCEKEKHAWLQVKEQEYSLLKEKCEEQRRKLESAELALLSRSSVHTKIESSALASSSEVKRDDAANISKSGGNIPSRGRSGSGPGNGTGTGGQGISSSAPAGWEKEMISLAKRQSDRFYEKNHLVSPPTTTTSGEVRRKDTNLEYLKNIVLQYMCSSEHEIQMALIPVIATMLQFSKEELQKVSQANKHWRL